MQYKNKTFIIIISIYIIFIIAASGTARAENISEKQPYKDNEILVKFKNASPEFLENFSDIFNLTCLSEKNPTGKENYFLFSLNDTSSVAQKIREVKKYPRVKKAQPNYIYRPAKKKSQQDPFFGRQWWILNDGSAGLAGADICLPGLWPSEQKTWASVIIGIIDTGVYLKHTDLKKNIVAGYDFVHGSKKNKNITDKDGHGTFIAGLIAAQVNNKKGIAGLSRTNRLKIMPLKFDFSTDQAVTALSYARERGVRIINISWGTNEYDGALYEAIKNFPGLIVAAAGNEAAEHTSENHFFPCDFDLDNILCVGASSESDLITSYSDYGVTYVDILAPGGEESPLISLGLKKNRYVSGEGTSYATALTSGAAGMVLSANPSISNAEIKDSIINNARQKTELADKVFSSGILNIKAAVNRENALQ
jgi:hypothetical protein